MGLPLDWHRAPASSSTVGNDSQVVGNLQRANGTNGFLSPSQRSSSATDLTVQVSLGLISGKAFYVTKYVLGLWMPCMLQKFLVHASQICVAHNPCCHYLGAHMEHSYLSNRACCLAWREDSCMTCKGKILVALGTVQQRMAPGTMDRNMEHWVPSRAS